MGWIEEMGLFCPASPPRPEVCLSKRIPIPA
jgi:hypothetical protein